MPRAMTDLISGTWLHAPDLRQGARSTPRDPLSLQHLDARLNDRPAPAPALNESARHQPEVIAHG